MRLSEQTKSTRLYRLYRVLFWFFIVVPLLLVPLSVWVENNLVRVQLETSSLHEKVRLQHEINKHVKIDLVFTATFVLALIMPLPYRALLYILDGPAAFRPKPPKPRTSKSPPKQDYNPHTDHEANSPDPFTVLGISRNSTFEEIRSAYRTKMQAYHPDKVASLGVELRELAERKSKQINEAFELLSHRQARK